LVGLVDQSLSSAAAPYAASAAAYQIDHAFVQSIEAQVPAGSMIFQLPYVEFPESPLVNNVGDADQLRMYLNSTTLRWSAAGIKGRPQSDWPTAVSSRRPQVMVRSLATIGFSGVVLDRKRVGGADSTVEKSLLPYLGAPLLISADQRYAYFNLAAALAQISQSTPPEELADRAAELINPVMAYPGLDFDPLDRSADGVSYRLWKSRGNNGSVTVVNDRNAPATVHLQVELGSDRGAPDVQLMAGDTTFVVKLPATKRPPIDADGNPVDPTFVSVDQVVTVPAGTSRLTLSPGPQTLAGADAAGVQSSFQRLFLLDSALVG
jgi:phosphoglycerol transferase